MQSFKSKFENQFFLVSQEGPQHSFLKNTVKVQYIRSKNLAARTFFRVFITHWGLHNAHSLDSKAIGQLVAFPR